MEPTPPIVPPPPMNYYRDTGTGLWRIIQVTAMAGLVIAGISLVSTAYQVARVAGLFGGRRLSISYFGGRLGLVIVGCLLITFLGACCIGCLARGRWARMGMIVCAYIVMGYSLVEYGAFIVAMLSRRWGDPYLRIELLLNNSAYFTWRMAFPILVLVIFTGKPAREAFGER